MADFYRQWAGKMQAPGDASIARPRRNISNAEMFMCALSVRRQSAIIAHSIGKAIS